METAGVQALQSQIEHLKEQIGIQRYAIEFLFILIDQIYKDNNSGRGLGKNPLLFNKVTTLMAEIEKHKGSGDITHFLDVIQDLKKELERVMAQQP